MARLVYLATLINTVRTIKKKHWCCVAAENENQHMAQQNKKAFPLPPLYVPPMFLMGFAVGTVPVFVTLIHPKDALNSIDSLGSEGFSILSFCIQG